MTRRLRLVTNDNPPKPPDPRDIAEQFDPMRLRQVMDLAEMSTHDVAIALDIKPFYIQDLLVGAYKPHPKYVTAFATMFGYPITYFATGRPFAHLDSSQIFFCGTSIREQTRL